MQEALFIRKEEEDRTVRFPTATTAPQRHAAQRNARAARCGRPQPPAARRRRRRPPATPRQVALRINHTPAALIDTPVV